MKRKIILILCLLVYSFKITAQVNSFEASIPNFNIPSALVMTKDSGWIIGGWEDRKDVANLIQLDKNGIVIRSNALDFQYKEMKYLVQMLTDSQGNIYTLSNQQEDCDVFHTDNFSWVFKFSKDLVLQWQKKVQINRKTPLPHRHGGFVFDSKNNLIVLTGEIVCKLDPISGNIINKDSISNTAFTDIFITSNDDRIIISSDTIIKTDSASKIIWEKAFAYSSIKKVFSNSFLAVSDSVLSLIDTGLNVIATYKYGGSYKSVYAATSDHSNIFITANHGSSDTMSYLLKFDSLLNLLSTKNILRMTNPVSMVARGNIISVLGTDKTKDGEMRPYLSVTDSASEFLKPDLDAGVIRIIPGKVVYDQLAEYYTIDVYLLIKNFGNKTIDEISAYTDGAVVITDCNIDMNPYNTFTNLNLAPGDTIKVHLGKFMQNEFEHPSVTFDVCAYTCSPNGEVDKNPHNDYICDSFFYTGIELSKAAARDNIRIFPNIQSDNLLNANYEVINTLGQIMINEKFSNTSSVSLNIETLPAGVYYIQLYDEKNISQLKFVKE